MIPEKKLREVLDSIKTMLPKGTGIILTTVHQQEADSYDHGQVVTNLAPSDSIHVMAKVLMNAIDGGRPWR